MKERKTMTHYEIFAACFPELDLSKEAFETILPISAENVIERREKGKLIGYAVTDGNALRLLCVLPEHQGRGVGSALLNEAESRLRQAGETELIVGGTGSRLFIGAPEKAKGFFEKRGYPVTDHYDEMTGDLSGFRAADFSLPVPEGVAFGWYHGNFEKMRQAVAQVDDSWPQYFNEDQPVFCATLNGEIASFCAVDEWENCLLSNGHNRVGAPGCVGTVPAFRRRGIGLKMVALACEELKKQGCDTVFIHYTGVAHWYAKLGFRVFLTQYFCRKRL